MPNDEYEFTVEDGKLAQRSRELKARFPLYRYHREAVCFNCGQQLDIRRAYDGGYPIGQGFWAQDCDRCQMTTFYDVVRPAPKRNENSNR